MAYEKDTDLYEDVLLSYDHVQLLSSREGIAAFFSTLHYNTDARVEQTTAAMGFVSENLRSTIKYIERIAFHEDFDSFSVYLFELQRLTVAIRNEIVKGFRNRPGNYLLILTDDYERLDFVLVERYTQTITTREGTYEVQPLLPGNKPVLVRPRVLQVARRTPDDVDLRVLRRFTYTEGDTIAQYEKLLNAYIVAAWSEPFFNNRALFSDYYLTQRLPERPEWKDEREYNALRKAFKRLLVVYDGAREECRNQPEKIIWKQLLEPVFQELGFTAQLTKASTKENALNPYYRLFASSSSSSTREKPLALCLTYSWERNLDGKDDQRDSQTPDENPGAVVVTLLDAGESDWAIVTNGIIWRLYAAKAHSRATNYYEINLQETLALDPSKREEAFRYFWLFFRAASFIPTELTVEGEPRPLSLLDDLLLQSDLHARELGERLKNRVFEEIFPHFALGFVQHAQHHHLIPPPISINANALDIGERDRLLEPYFTGTLTFLYRLLFLFYAENRDLLPVRQERSYYESSLERLKREIAQKAGNVQDRVANNLTDYSENSTAIYDRLALLFAAVDKGNAVLNVPIYNGGLFMTNPPPQTTDEPQEITVARFLQEHKITDRQLALGLDLMARDVDEKSSRARLATGEANEHSHALIFIDYKSLGVRHLGSIYEGLLEFKLRIAPETMAVVEGKRTEEIITYSEAKQQNRRILKVRQGKDLKERLYAKGAVYLENDRRERKATGSYYTPDYIVQYIVEQTVGPILKEKLEALRPVFRSAQEHLKSQQNAWKALRRTDADPEFETYRNYRISLNEVFFDLKVLDPAMGSGHFLVEAVDYITDQMAKFLNSFRWNPIVYELALTRKKIEDGMREQGVTVDRDKLTDLNLLKRRVLKSCIYGVDLNPMAVELAKVSLWLDCFTLGAPLSFLDHHIKCGNSLIGADVESVHRGISENLFGYQFGYLLQAAQLMRGVSKLSDVTAREVAESHETYQQAYEALAPYKRLFNVWLSQYFGNKKAQDVANQYAQEIIDNTYIHLNASDVTIVNAALPLATSKRFFHWELEFPEVFFDEAKRKENGGFDAVVGNPPYVSAPAMVANMPIERKAIEERYKLLTMKWDLYCAFLELSYEKIVNGGATGLIIPSQVLYQDYAKWIRKELVNKCQLEFIADFSDIRVFNDAMVMTCVLIFRRVLEVCKDKGVNIIKLMAERMLEDDPLALSKHTSISQSIFLQTSNNLFRIEGSDAITLSLGQKISARIYRLGDICYGSVGVVPHSEKESKQKEHYIYPYKHDSKCKPYIEGKEVDRYRINWRERFLQYDYSTVRRPSLPELLESPKLILKIVAGKSGLNATVDYSGFYGDHSFVMFTQKYRLTKVSSRTLLLDLQGIELSTDYELEFLLSIINSSLIGWYFQKNLTTNLNIGPDDAKELPIRRINFSTPPNERARCLDKAKLLYQQCVSKDDQACVLGFVNHHLAKEPEESDVAHDLLAFLAEEMLRLNKEKRALQKEFLDYFVDAVQIKSENGKAGIEVLTGKSKLLEFAGDYQKGEEPLTPEALWEIVQKNRSRLNAGRVGLKERVLARYQESLDQVLPLKEQLRRTDALIDQVVYRLYGLTEEEIAIVEGKG